MKYNININQRAAVENGFDLDVIDLAIFDFIKDFGGSPSCTQLHTDEGLYMWISHKLIINNLPLIGIKSTQGIIRRIDKLVECNLITKHPRCEQLGKTLYRFGSNYSLMVFDTPISNLPPLNKNIAPPSKSIYPPLNKYLGDNNIIDNNIIDKVGGDPAVTFKGKIFTKWTKEEFKASIQEAREKRAENPKQPNFSKEMLNEFYLYWIAPHKSGKMFFATQDKWDTFQRLITWQNRDNKK